MQQGLDLDGKNLRAKVNIIKWLRKVVVVKVLEQLGLVRQMLEANPKQRIKAQVLVNEVEEVGNALLWHVEEEV